MIQVGNELSNGLLWPEGQVPAYDNIAKFVETCPFPLAKVSEQAYNQVRYFL